MLNKKTIINGVRMMNSPLRKLSILTALTVSLFSASNLASAGKADVVKVTYHKLSSGNYNFHVSIQHDDSGWDHYANRWEILDLQGNILAVRDLRHPQLDKDTYQKTKNNIEIPEGIRTVQVRAHDIMHGYGGHVMTVELE